jgi:hypothetical protein
MALVNEWNVGIDAFETFESASQSSTGIETA